MEDQRQEEHIKLATEYGKTQLNSGHLVDNKGQLRGKGTELRTDEWGTLRAGKGLFVAADAQAKAQGDVLDMAAALKEIDRLNQQLQQLEMAAEKAQALKGDVDSQIQMFAQRLKALNEAVLFSAPEGMALTSGEDMQLTAGRNLALNAGEDLSVGVMGNLTTLAGEKLGFFARTGQLSLKASEGPMDVQAQNASMRLFAEKKLTLSSASDISFVGKKRITLIGGGSYLKLEAGKVEYGTTATYIRKVKRTMAAAPMAMNNSPPDELQFSGSAKNPGLDKGPDKLTTETVITIPADRSRRRIGVGEAVMLTCSSPVSAWTISPAGKGKVRTSGSNSAVLTAFDKAGNVTVIATTANGKNSVQFTIVEPSAFVMNRVSGTDLIHHNGAPDCGWLSRPYLHPVDVNFAAVSIRERDSQAVGTGPYKALTGRWHGRYNPSDPKNGTSQWFRIDANEYSATDGSTLSPSVTDTIFAGIGGAAGSTPPFTHCILSMPIVWEWTIDRSKIHSFPKNEQKHEIFADGKCTTSKASHQETTLYSAPDSGLSYI
jgi:type VI secretion system secreted protein VgrG